MRVPAQNVLVAIILVAVHFGTACAGHRMRQVGHVLKEYKQAFQLELKSPPVVTAGEQVDVELQIHNKGGRPLEACLGDTRYVTLLSDTRAPIDGREPVAGSGNPSVHPGCKRRFTLDPGAGFGWSEAVAMPNVVPGPARLMIDVQIVSPHHCDKYGCYDTTLKATARVSVR